MSKTNLFFWGTPQHYSLVTSAAEKLPITPITGNWQNLADVLAHSTSIVLLYSSPAAMVAQSVGELPLNNALNLWQQSAEALLSLHKQNRRKLILINIEQPLAENAPVPTSVVKALSTLQGSIKPSLAELIAQVAITNSLELQQLAAMLTAISLPTDAVVADTLALFTELTQLQQNQVTLAETVQQQSLLQQQLQLVQQELEAVFLEKQQLQLQLTPLNTQLSELKAAQQQALAAEETLKAKIEEASSKQQELTGENELLLLQLMQVQEELEKYYLQGKNLQTEVAQQQAKLETHEQKFAQLQQQNTQLKTQLSNQQHSYNQLQQAHINAQRDATARQNHSNMLLKQTERELAKAQVVIDKLQRQLAAASLNGQQAQAELKAVKNSTLWKAMAPVRKITSDTKKKQLQLQKDIALVRNCPLFNTNWYLQLNPDVAELNKDPIEHYVRFGAKEGRLPGPDFDGNWYISHYPDVAQSGMNPLVHYIKFGQIEGRQTSPKLLQLKPQTNRIGE